MFTHLPLTKKANGNSLSQSSKTPICIRGRRERGPGNAKAVRRLNKSSITMVTRNECITTRTTTLKPNRTTSLLFVKSVSKKTLSILCLISIPRLIDKGQRKQVITRVWIKEGKESRVVLIASHIFFMTLSNVSFCYKHHLCHTPFQITVLD